MHLKKSKGIHLPLSLHLSFQYVPHPTNARRRQWEEAFSLGNEENIYKGAVLVLAHERELSVQVPVILVSSTLQAQQSENHISE